MIFETLNDSARRGELWLVNYAMCHWHLRRDGQLTIREIIVLPKYQGMGIGTEIVNHLKTEVEGTKSLFAKCPAELPANGWYEHLGFVLEGTETTKTGRLMNLWRMQLD